MINPNDQNDLRVMKIQNDGTNGGQSNGGNNAPNNLYKTDEGDWKAAPGYKFINPNNDQNDLRVMKIQDVYVGNSGKFLVVSSCNYIEDFNRNNILNYPEEFVGIKDKFLPDERITVYLGSNKIIEDIEYKLLNNNRDIVETIKVKNKFMRCSEYNEKNDKRKDSELPAGRINRLEAGSYRAIWYSNNQLLAMLDFEVVDKK